jgi:CRP-like cAMP-binding protein
MKSKETGCDLCGRLSTGVFCSLEQVAQFKLDAGKTTHRFGAGNVLFYEGSAPLAVYCVQLGLVKLAKSTPDGRSVLIRLLGRGDIAGFRAVIANEPYAASAVVVEPSEVCIIPADTFRGLIEESPQFRTALITKLAAELRISEERMLDQAVLPARVRIARLLLFLADQTIPGSDRRVIETNLLRQDLAEAVGVTPQTFSRILHQLNNEGLVKSTRSHIVITGLRRLQTIAASGT